MNAVTVLLAGNPEQALRLLDEAMLSQPPGGRFDNARVGLHHLLTEEVEGFANYAARLAGQDAAEPAATRV